MGSAAVLGVRRSRRTQLPVDSVLQVVLPPRSDRMRTLPLAPPPAPPADNDEDGTEEDGGGVALPAFVALPASHGYDSTISSRFMQRYSKGLIVSAVPKPAAQKPVRGYRTEDSQQPAMDYLCVCCGRDNTTTMAGRQGWKVLNEGGAVCLCPDCFLLESILTHKWKGSKCWFRVKWQGCDEFSWVPEEHVHREMIEAYFHEAENRATTHPKKRRRTSSSTRAGASRKKKS